MTQEEIMHVPMVVSHHRHHHVEQGGNDRCAPDVVFVVLVVLVVRVDRNYYPVEEARRSNMRSAKWSWCPRSSGCFHDDEATV